MNFLFFKGDKATKNISIHVVQSFIFKAGSLIITFSLVPLSLKYLNNDQYGLWLTLISFINYFQFLDVGLGNGLRNKLTESLSGKKNIFSRKIVSSAYIFIAFICIFFAFLTILIVRKIDWITFFNTDISVSNDISVLIIVIFLSFFSQLFLKLIVNIYQAYQHHSILEKLNFCNQFLSLLFVLYLIHFNRKFIAFIWCSHFFNSKC